MTIAEASPNAGTLSLQQLEQHLWGAADILRGSIDSSDYKHYIFGLLFYKRRSDVWKDIRKHPTNVGEHLNAAFRAIEDANLRLKGVFQDVDFSNKEWFPEVVLERLLQHFERYRLRNGDVEPDMLGNAYEYLIAQLADDAGKKGAGRAGTPKRSR